MRRCVIWGSGDEYETIINQVKYEELKGNLECGSIIKNNLPIFKKTEWI